MPRTWSGVCPGAPGPRPGSEINSEKTLDISDPGH